PAGPRQRGGPNQELQNIVAAQRERVALLPLVRRLAEELRRRGALDFGSQMSLAARLSAEHAEVGRAERTRFRLVLLDEYQDTGHAQRILLAALFGDLDSARGEASSSDTPAVQDCSSATSDRRPDDARGSEGPWRETTDDADPAVRDRLAVTAVGDPMQSIYGWRGASAAN
ncbi:UvrD-helicase domain-containing protein, partial [Nocardia gipuzkoensis]